MPLTIASYTQAAPLRVALAQTELRLYPDAAAFQAHMAQRTAAAMATSPKLIVFPEDIGLPLVMVDHYDLIKDCSVAEDASRRMLGAHEAQVEALCGKSGVTPVRALFILEAPQVSKLYRETFSALAKQHHVYIAAGSAPLLWPDEKAGPANVSYLFSPEGEIVGRTPKVNLTPLERSLNLVAAPAAAVKPWQTPIGRLGMLICADAFHPEIAQSLKEQGAQVLVSSSANPELWATEETTFQTESLPPRVVETGLPGLQCFAVGHLFELPFEGQSQILAPGGEKGYSIQARAETWNTEEIVAGMIELP